MNHDQMMQAPAIYSQCVPDKVKVKVKGKVKVTLLLAVYCQSVSRGVKPLE
jgi:hypothetical protein